MSLLAIAIIALQIYCVFHAYKNGNQQWIWIIIIAPGVGSAAYALAHLMPELFGSWGVRRSAKRVVKLIDPTRDQRVLALNLERADTPHNRQALAAELLELERFDEAEELYRSCLTGINAHAPDLLLGLARACRGAGKLEGAKQALDELKSHNPEFRSPDAHLLYARILVDLKQYPEALEEFEVLKDSYPGEEARFAYAELLLALDRREAAQALFDEIIKRTQLAPNHYARAQAEWVRAAKSALNNENPQR